MIPKFLDNALGFNIDRVAILLRRELIHVLSEYDITPEQWQIMITLWHSDYPLIQSEIVKMTLRDKHSISRMIMKLVNKGWIKKNKGEDDARQTFIGLTEKGESFRDEIPNKVKTYMSKMFGVLSSSESQQLFLIIQKLRTSIDDTCC